MEKPVIDEKLARMLNSVFAWAEAIRRDACKIKDDGIDDNALIIQELIEGYLRDCDINPRDIIKKIK